MDRKDFFLRIFRMNEWLPSKVAPIMGIVYLAILLCGLEAQKLLWILPLALCTAFGFAAFGYFYNDVFDVALDARHDKRNFAARFSVPVRVCVALGLAAVALLPWLALPFDRISITLIVAQFFFLLLYSTPPVRLKNSPLLSVVADALYAHAIPVVLAFHTFALAGGSDPFNLNFLLLLFVWQFMGGVRYFLNHLALDRAVDEANGTRTLAVKKGNRFVRGLIVWLVFPVEILAFAVLILGMTEGVSPAYSITVAAALTLCYILLPLLGGLRLDALLRYSFRKVPLDFFYQAVFPVINIVFVALVNRWFWFVLPVHILLFFGFPTVIFKWGRRFVWQPLRTAASFTVNNGIYLFYRFVLFRSEEKARGIHYEAYRQQRETVRRGAVAVVNINRDKYTETFVRGHIDALPRKTYFYYGGDLPLYEREAGMLLPAGANEKLWRRYLLAAWGLPPDYLAKKSLVRSLRKNHIRLILAEFGPVGAAVAPVAEENDIPLAVIFYGYDAYHKNVLEQQREGYADLFRTAKKIIAVSRDMEAQLERLGAPREKLAYLPCYVNLDRFPYSDHAANPPVFLCVGRFAETKSPHLTILAFHKVWQQHPQARLVMVGKDGGGELFEACHILVKALKLENHVEFKGILTPDEVHREMRNAYAFVQHSVTTPINGDKEGTPVAVMEAMACGLPVVVTRHAGINDMVEHGATGLMTDEFDIDTMAAHMVTLLQNPAQASEMGRRASETIRQNPLVKNHTQILWEMLEPLMG